MKYSHNGVLCSYKNDRNKSFYTNVDDFQDMLLNEKWRSAKYYIACYLLIKKERKIRTYTCICSSVQNKTQEIQTRIELYFNWLPTRNKWK